MSTSKKVSLLITLPTLVLAGFITLKYILIIKNINCNSCPKVITDLLSSHLKSPLVTLNQNQLEQDIKNTLPTEKVNISKKLPDTLNVEITLKILQIPIAFLSQDITGVSEDKLPASTTSRTVLLENGQVLTLKDQVSTNIFIDPSLNSNRLKQLSSFLKVISAKPLEYKTLFVQSNTIYIKLDSKQTVIVPLNKDPQVFISSLHSIQQDATIKTVKIIDFRYNNPVLK